MKFFHLFVKVQLPNKIIQTFITVCKKKELVNNLIIFNFEFTSFPLKFTFSRIPMALKPSAVVLYSVCGMRTYKKTLLDTHKLNFFDYSFAYVLSFKSLLIVQLY